MELKEGMYVRTKDGAIAKVEQIIDNEIHFNIKPIFSDGECLGYNWFYIKDVVKASNNIIDLIEVGDFISYIYPSGLGILGFEDVKVTEGLLNILQNGKNNHEYTIKSIVTKEQFESMEYSLEG